MEGRKDDFKKLRWDLLPVEIIERVVLVLTKGAEKYDSYNWMKVSNAKERYYAAAMRHIIAWRKGEIFDQEWNIEHLAHAICCLIFLMWFDKDIEQIPDNILNAVKKVKQLSVLKILPMPEVGKCRQEVGRPTDDNVKVLVDTDSGVSVRHHNHEPAITMTRKISPRKGTSFLPNKRKYKKNPLKRRFF
jgi:hypothetical protein